MALHPSEADAVARDHSQTIALETIAVLADRRRRHVLECLVDRTQAIPLADLAEDVAVLESGGSRTEVTETTVKRIATSLYHAHIPHLVDADVVEYETADDLVRVSGSTDRAERALSLVDSLDEDGHDS